MSFKIFLLEDLLQEGGRAIKGSQPMTQAEALSLGKLITKEAPFKVAIVGSAGKKPKDKKSGDVDIAIECSWGDCKKWAEKLGTISRDLKGLGIISVGLTHAGALRQVDLIPTDNLKLSEWAYWNDKDDLAAGLKGSHRNELFFSCAKHALDEGRYILNLGKGLEKRPERKIVATTPKAICKLLLGVSTPVMNLTEAVDAFLADTYPRPKARSDIVSTMFKGLTHKELSTDHPALERLQEVA